MGLARPGYNLLTRPFSDLATRGTSGSTVFDVGFFLVPGVLTILLGVGLYLAIGGGQAWRSGSVLIVGSGVFLVATGIFQQDPGSFVAYLLHGTMAQVCFALASVAPLVLFIGSADQAHIGPPRRVWLAAGILCLAVEVLAIAARPLVHYPDGLFQRPFTVVLTVWFVATGVWLLKVGKIQGLPVPE